MLKKLIFLILVLVTIGIYQFYTITVARRASRMAVCTHLCEGKKGQALVECKKNCMRHKNECHVLCDEKYSSANDATSAECHEKCEKGKP